MLCNVILCYVMLCYVMYVCVYKYIYIYVYVDICIYICVCMHIYIYMNMHMYMYESCMYIMYVCMYVCACVCIYVYISDFPAINFHVWPVSRLAGHVWADRRVNAQFVAEYGSILGNGQRWMVRPTSFLLSEERIEMANESRGNGFGICSIYEQTKKHTHD